MTCQLYLNLFLRFDWDFSLAGTLSNMSLESFTQLMKY
ncbi:hypothetical protein F383_32529 [Gossypium arboreum]|uniref:Uncharacterized protein n=1 Tax=Gossypium arboreum TaxID=29729 RepID=A0A0B0N0E9_GOSAR|nr:hypothetical protein F383_32529 [Gossypium arboreum]